MNRQTATSRVCVAKKKTTPCNKGLSIHLKQTNFPWKLMKSDKCNKGDGVLSLFLVSSQIDTLYSHFHTNI